MGAIAPFAIATGCSLSLDGYAGPPLVEASDDAPFVGDAGPDVTPPRDAADAAEEKAPAKPIVFVQANADRTRNAGTSSFAVTLQTPVTAHDSIVVSFYIGPQSATVTGVSDSLGNAYEVHGSQKVDAYGITMFLASAHDIKGGALATVTVATSGVNTVNLIVHEYANVASTVGCTHASGEGAAKDGIVAPGIMLTAPGSLLFAYALAGVVGPGTGFMPRTTFDNDITEDRVVAAPGLASAFASVTGSTPSWGIIAGGFAPR